MPELLHLMVDLTPATAYWRGVITGAARYCREHAHVRLRTAHEESELIGDADAVDGVIAVIDGNDPAPHALRFGKPVVNVSSVRLPVRFPTVTIDNAAIGRMAADHLLAQGYRRFAFHMEGRVYFSNERRAGFAARLAEAGHPCAVFDTAPGTRPDNSPAALRAATSQWLRGLQRPLGLCTHSDVRAAMLIDICRDAGLNVPSQVGVIGVDDDEVVVNASTPPLSSVDNAPELVGYRAAALLVERLVGPARAPEREGDQQPILIPPRRVVQRQSTQPVFTDDELLDRAVTFIREHATDPIGIADVLEVVPLSRRSLERRFRQRLGRSPGDEIRRVQMQKAQWLLAETDHTLARVASATGYTRFRNFASAFRRETGVGPTAYRRQFRMR